MAIEDALKSNKSQEQLDAEHDKVTNLMAGLSYFIGSTKKGKGVQMEGLNTFWQDIEEQRVNGTLNLEQTIQKLNDIFEKMKNLALTSGASPEEISPEKLESYNAMLSAELDAMDGKSLGQVLTEEPKKN